MPSPSFLLHRLRRTGATLFLCAVAPLAVEAATLTADATLHIQPDDSAPSVGTIPAGTSITPLLRESLATAGVDAPPPGWIATRSSGPFTGFVRNSDVQSDGSIRAGAEIRVQPLADAPLLLVVEAGDDTNAREPMGDWSRATIRTELIVYVNALPAASRSEVTPAAEEATVTANVPAAVPEVAVAPPAPASQKIRRPKAAKPAREPKPEPVLEEMAAAPRVFEGYLLRTRRFLGRGPIFDYQLVDEKNRRIALLDLSALLATSTLESFENRRISVYGPGLRRSDISDLVIRVQTLRLGQ